jgi:hypothetical protein
MFHSFSIQKNLTLGRVQLEVQATIWWSKYSSKLKLIIINKKFSKKLALK